ncbi:hypothetical protein KQH65_06475 [archaeon]|nr:hypothetical protein [archaeon]
MKIYNERKPVLISLFLLGALLVFVLNYTELSFMDIKIGYVGQKTDKEITYSYTLFNGKESTSLYLEENQTLSLVVEAKI